MSQPKATFYMSATVKDRLDTVAETNGILQSKLVEMIVTESLDVVEKKHTPLKQTLRDGLNSNSDFIKKFDAIPKKSNKKKKKKDKPN